MRLFYRFGIVCFILLLAFAVQAETAKKEEKRKSHTLVLENGLAVLLQSDPEVHRSAAALAVGVGHIYDPKEKMGLAHYLEHMLFLGTKKYPDVDDYKQYLSKNSGASNAYTSSDVTNYFFQSSHESFEGALDRFSQFFIAPLFDKKYAAREVKAVSSEHDKNTRSDGWRSSYLKDKMSEPGHPLQNFGTGNLKTLEGDNRPDLLKFYKKYYSANNMRLALLSKLSLKEQEALVRKYFSQVPSFKVNKPEISPDYRKPLKDQYRLLKIKTIKDIRNLSLEFPTIRLVEHLDSKPASIIGHILGHEGKGSLLSKLKEEGLALGLSAGGGFSHPSINSIDINISLTRKGVDQYERILELFFAYIEKLRKQGVKEYSYKEIQTMAQIDFDWKNPSEGMGYVSGKASQMHRYQLDEVLTLPFLYKKYDPEAYAAILDSIVPQNMMVTLQHNAVETDQKEEFYGTEYAFQTVGGKSFERLAHPPAADGMVYPPKNDFIPNDLQVAKESPHLVVDTPLSRVWFQFDHRFEQPKVAMKLQIQTPKVFDTLQNYAMSKLYNVAVLEGLNEQVYPIKLAGLNFGLSASKKGVTLSVGGYNERIQDLLRLVTDNLIEIRIDEEKFGNIKEAMLRGLKNQKLGQAFHRSSYYSSLIWIKKQYTEDEIIAALEPLTLDDIKRFAKTLYERVFITGIAYGNWTDRAVQESVENLLKQLESSSLPEDERYKEEIEVLASGEALDFSRKIADNNNSISYTLQVGEKEAKLQVAASLLAAIIKSDFYTQMRTNQQLGYIVWSYYQRLENRVFLKFIIQSAGYGPQELKKRVEQWFPKSLQIVEALTDEEFEKHRESLIISFEKEGDSIGEVLRDLYYLATEEKGDFEYKRKLIRALKNLKKEDVVALAHRLLKNPETPRLAILIRSQGNDTAIAPQTYETVEELKNRKHKEARVSH